MTDRRGTRTKIALGTWRAPVEGRIHARAEVDVTAALAHAAEATERSGVRVTLTHVVGAALGRAMRAVPEARARVSLGRVVTTDDCTVAFAVDVEEGHDLAPVRVAHCDRLSPVEVARALEHGAARLRRREDAHHDRTNGIIRWVPTPLMRPAMAVAGSLVGGLGVGAFGQPGRPLGTAFVSNVGSIGLDEGYLAPAPFARAAVYLSVGRVLDRPVAVNGEVVVRPVSVLVATADHRFVDGAHAGRLQSVVLGHLADPATLTQP